MRINFLLFSTLVLFASCSTELKYEMSNHKFLTPETKGAFLKGDVALAYQENQKVILATAYDTVIFPTQPELDTSSSIDRSGGVSIPITLGLLNRVDLFTLNSKYGMKFQFLGSPENEKKSEWKAAIALAYGADDGDTSNVTFGGVNNARTYSTEIKVKNYDVNLIVGKRLADTFLLYLSIMRDYYHYNGRLSSTQFPSLNITGHSVNYGAFLGGHVTEEGAKRPFFFKAEGGVVDGKLDKRNSRTAASFAGEVGWSW